MNTHARPDPLGLYIHIPFCARLCPYCDFAVSIQKEIPHQAYTAAVCAELRARADEFHGAALRTLYFGGGTPALLAPDGLAALIDEARGLAAFDDDIEVTLETNPNQVTDESLVAWQSLGIQRLSIGCQSFQDRHLQALRRNHDGEAALMAVRRALEVMDRISLDLIFAGPDQTDGEWEADLLVVRDLVERHGLTHLSAYQLTIEPGTAFDLYRRRGRLNLPPEERSDGLLTRLVEMATEVGLRRYEVSNFARRGHESRHNSSYWQAIPYVGVGVGAHSLAVFPDGAARRRANPRRYGAYMAAPTEAAEVERLTPREHLSERLFLGIRSRLGVHLDALREQFQDSVPTAVWPPIIAELKALEDDGLLESRADHYRPTNSGLDLGDTLAARLFQTLG